MTNAQLFFTIGVPFALNGALLALLVVYLNARLSSLQDHIISLREHDDIQFVALNQRFDDMRDLWRAALHRVEEVLDARLKHLEEREAR